MNVKLLEATKKRILKAPKRLNMYYYGTSCKGINLDHLHKNVPKSRRGASTISSPPTVWSSSTKFGL